MYAPAYQLKRAALVCFIGLIGSVGAFCAPTQASSATLWTSSPTTGNRVLQAPAFVHNPQTYSATQVLQVPGHVVQASETSAEAFPMSDGSGSETNLNDPVLSDNSSEDWRVILKQVGAVIYCAVISTGGLLLGFKHLNKKQAISNAEEVQSTGRNKLKAWAMAAVGGVDSADSNQLKFLLGVGWFMAHQLIGVGNDVIMKYAGGDLAVAQIVFLRFSFATLSMLPVMFASGLDSFRTNRLTLHFARSMLLAAGIALYCTGLTIAPIAVVTTLNFTIPLFTLVLSSLILKERVGPLRWFATLAGFLGVCVVLQPGHMAFNPQWLTVLLGASCFASLDVLNKAFVGKESFWAMIFYTALFTACITAYPAMQVWAPVSTTQLGLLAVLGSGANLLLYCLLKSFSFVDASALAPFRYTELLWSALVGFLFFAEVPAVTTLLGALVIVPSTLFVVWQESKGGNADPAPETAAEPEVV